MLREIEIEALEPPNHNSVLLMKEIDGMAKAWRALVYEYGLVAVRNVRESNGDIDDAEDQLWLWRSRRQKEWLATDYIKPSMRFTRLPA